MTSRADFMRSLGITNDDVRVPEETTAPRGALRTQKSNLAASSGASLASNAAAGAASSSSTSMPSSTSSYARGTTKAVVPESASAFESSAAPSRNVGYGASATANTDTSFGAPKHTAGAAAPSASSSGSNKARAEFLKSLGIDNADTSDVPPEKPQQQQRQQQQQRDAAPYAASASSYASASSFATPLASRSAAVKDVLRRTEAKAFEEEAESPTAPRFGPRAGSGVMGGGAGGGAGLGGGRSRGAGDPTPNAPSPVSLDSSYASSGGFSHNVSAAAAARLDSSLNGPLRRGAPGASTGSSSKLDSSMSNAGPLLDAAGMEVPADATADDLKKHGNTFYEAGDFRKAVRFYSRAIDRAPNNEVLYSNRSAAYLLASKQMALDTRTMALRDADKCIELKPTWFKGFSRRGDALFKMERYDEACDAYRGALERDPSNAAIQASLDQCKACCQPKKDTSFAWSQPNDRVPSVVGGGGGAGSGPAGSSRSDRAGSLAGSTKTAHELVDEYRVAAARATGTYESAADYRERELAKFRMERTVRGGSTASGGCNSSGSSSMMHSGSESTSMSGGAAAAGGVGAGGSALNMSGSGAGVNLDAYESNGTAAAYQQNLLDSYRRKKAMQGK